MRRHHLVLLALAGVPGLASAQSERALKREFEGTMVTVQMDMPGTEDGVDVYPESSAPIDYARYAQRLKTYGVALHSGQSVMVTKVKVKDDLIEFQLGGGGFGTMGDDASTTVSTPPVSKSQREKDLEKAVKNETDRDKKKELQRQLDDLRRDREREDRRNQASVAAASEQRRESVRRQRADGGSRFNIRYRGGVPASAVTPESIRDALARYVSFGDSRNPDSSDQDRPAPGTLRLGMLLREVEAMLGPAASATEKMEGTLRVMERTYTQSEGRIRAEFVEGVLVRFRQSTE
jgi:hypothetical protein